LLQSSFITFRTLRSTRYFFLKNLTQNEYIGPLGVFQKSGL
jgi:hypothetical protein